MASEIVIYKCIYLVWYELNKNNFNWILKIYQTHTFIQNKTGRTQNVRKAESFHTILQRLVLYYILCTAAYYKRSVTYCYEPFYCVEIKLHFAMYFHTSINYLYEYSQFRTHTISTFSHVYYAWKWELGMAGKIKHESRNNNTVDMRL